MTYTKIVQGESYYETLGSVTRRSVDIRSRRHPDGALSSSGVWTAEHVGMPFGTTSAGASWHRFGNLVSAAGRRLCLLFFGRFVDGYFGVDPQSVTVSGGE